MTEYANASALCCPVCGQRLARKEKSFYCPKGHCFDAAKSGYVNLLLAQDAKQHGDDKAMVRARTAFLERGYYQPLADAVSEFLRPYLPAGAHLLDAGCGEGWYTERIAGPSAHAVGVDISKDALATAAKRFPRGEFAVASLYHLPVEDAWADVVLNLFAPECPEEFARVLKPRGVWLKVLPLPEHLMELKRIVYDTTYENSGSLPNAEGFSLLSSRDLRYSFFLPDRQAISDLFTMTPYYHKTAPQDRAKLDAVPSLEVSAAFRVALYSRGGGTGET